MDYSELVTPQMLAILLPTLGFSIVMNVLLLAALFFRSLRGWLFGQVYTYWLSLRMTARSNH